MDSTWIQPIFLVLQTLLLYFLTRLTTREIFYFFRRITNSEKLGFFVLSLLFFPGTVLHEMAHFFFATALLLPVKEIHIFPKFEDEQVRLGAVYFAKKDFIRGIIVGLAPIFVGIFFLWGVSAWKLFPSTSLFQNIIFAYLIFAISSTMFSSKKDLVDLIYLVPLILIVAAVAYIFNINLNNLNLSGGFLPILRDINIYLFYSIIINFALFVLFKISRFFL